MKRSSSPLVIMIPLIVISLIIGGVFVYKALTSASTSQQVVLPSKASPVAPGLTGQAGKPTVGFDKLQAANPVSDLRQEFDSSSTDAGITDLDSLQTQASTL